MASDPDIRTEAKRLVENLPTGASWDDLMYEIYVRQAVELGLADADAGRTMDHETAVARIRARFAAPRNASAPVDGASHRAPGAHR